ncbi:unnamed protein product [Paramecium sonneborni]|uniref:Uncharacterized protein n=1 Tax=Paramecium sonneborni TaxID=65129 RepID=A0A8S1LXS2_9CILI|nr:unnamed protein product [Paramecium sonneborni]
MNNNLKNTYNQISDVFSKTQIKNAVESLKTYKDRLKLIDSIIDRRQEIIQANDFSKISKYAQTFSKMIIKFKNPEENDMAINQRLQMQMVINKFLQKNIKHSLSPPSLPKELIQDSITSPLSHKKNFTLKKPSQRTNRYFSSLDSLNNQSKWLDIKSDEERDIRSLEKKIKQSLILKTRISQDLNQKEQDNNLKLYLKKQGLCRKNKIIQSSEPILPALSESEQQNQSKQTEFKIKDAQEFNCQYLNQIQLKQQFQQFPDKGAILKSNKKYQTKREIFDKSNIILCSLKI